MAFKDKKIHENKGQKGSTQSPNGQTLSLGVPAPRFVDQSTAPSYQRDFKCNTSGLGDDFRLIFAYDEA